jgi:hypothetical protein
VHFGKEPKNLSAEIAETTTKEQGKVSADSAVSFWAAAMPLRFNPGMFFVCLFMAYIILAGSEGSMTKRDRFKLIVALTAVSFSWLGAGSAVEMEKKESRQEGEYRVYSSGREIGVEKYVLVTSQDAVTSSSTLEFRNPGNGPQRVSLESRLEMNGAYLPHSYELKSEVDGQKGSIRGEFASNQVIFEYSGNGRSFGNGLLVGDRYTILDTNLFHHFIFLARLFKYDSGEKPQTFEVVIPQDRDTGTLKIRELNKETILIRGKKFNTVHLLVDTGSVQIQLWVDSARTPRKIAVPDKGIEVLHSN